MSTTGEIDPTGTTTVRRRLGERLRGRWRAVIREVNAGVGERDALDLQGTQASGDAVALAADYEDFTEYNDPEAVPESLPGRAIQKIRGFMDWLTESLHDGVLQVIQPNTNPYLRHAFSSGVEDTREALADGGVIDSETVDPDSAREPEPSGRSPLDFFMPGGGGDGDRDPDDILDRDSHRSKLGELYEKTHDKLTEIVDDVTSEVRDTLESLLGRGDEADDVGPQEAADRITDRLESVGIYRSDLLGETSPVEAHADGVLSELEAVGVDEVQIRGEWVSKDDDLVCPICESIDGGVFTINQIRNEMFSYIAEQDPNADESDSHLTGQYPLKPPAHPLCRCRLVPFAFAVGEETAREASPVD